MAKDKFREVVNNSVNPGRDRLLKNFKIKELNIYPPNHPGLKNSVYLVIKEENSII